MLLHASHARSNVPTTAPIAASRPVAQPQTSLRLRDDRSGGAHEERWRIIEAADRRASPAPAHELDGRLKLGSHRSRLELLQIQIVRARGRKGSSTCPTPVKIDAIDVGQQEEAIRTQFTGEQRAGMVLVNHGLDAVQTAVVGARHRNAPATDANDDDASGRQQSDYGQFQNG